MKPFFQLVVSMALLHVSHSAIVDSADCGVTKSCFSSGNVSLVTWAVSVTPGCVDIELSAITDGWVAVGFSYDKLMDTDSVTECVRNGSGVLVQQSYNNAKWSNVAATNPQTGVVSVETAYIDGRLECRLRRNISVTGDPQFYNLNGTFYYILLAFGPNSSPGTKTYHSGRAVTDAAIDIMSADYRTTEKSSDSIHPTVKAHGCLMMAAWLLTASAGIVVARHYRGAFTGKRVLNQQLWLLIHRVCLITAVAANIVGFIVVFVHVGGYLNTDSLPSSFLKSHPVMGIIVTILAVINPIFVMARPSPGRSLYKPLTIAHRVVGTIVHPLAAITIFSGIMLRFYDNSVSNDPLFWLMVATVSVQVAAELVLFIHAQMPKFMSDNKGGSGDLSANQIKVETAVSDGLSGYKKFRLVFLPLYLVIMAGLYIAMTVVLVTFIP